MCFPPLEITVFIEKGFLFIKLDPDYNNMYIK